MQEVRFTGHGGAALVGSLHLPARGPAPVVVAVHGAGSGTRAARLHEHLVDLLPGHGVGAFVFDRRGEGASGGEPDAPLSILADDVVAAVEAVRERTGVDAERIGLWAHSQGGWIAPLAATRTSNVGWLTVVGGAGVSPSAQMRFAVAGLLRAAGHDDATVDAALTLRRRAELAAAGAPDPTLRDELAAARDRPWFAVAAVPDPDDPATATFEHDLDLGPVLRALEIPALLVYGERDRWIPIDASIEVWRRSYGDPDAITVLRVPGTAASLELARRRERDAERMRRDLITTVSHDLRTPLASLRAMTEAIDDGVVDDEPTLSRYRSEMRRSVQQLAGLVDDLFELTQLDAGAIAAETTRARLGDVAEIALAAVGPAATEKRLVLESELGAAADAWCSPRVARVLQNLLVNAVRHTPADGTVRVLASVDDDRLRLAVEDTGEGIAAHDLERVFEPFFRADPARSGPGAGLGLALAKRIVEMLGGRIGAESVPGAGARFDVELPVA